MSYAGRYCDIHSLKEEKELSPGADLREPRYRREVFHRFFQFHLMYKSSPGLVYGLFPFLMEHEKWPVEQRLWFAYINGNTQNPVTSWRIFREFPDLYELRRPAEWQRFLAWWGAHAKQLAFDTDRRYFRTKFPQAVERYLQLTRGEQAKLFEQVAPSKDPHANFRRLWQYCSKNYIYFGRLSVFSYLEYLRIMGVNVSCDQLFLDDMDGSKSHRNGLAKVLGRDDLDWHASNPSFNGKYTSELLAWLTTEAAELLREAHARAVGKAWAKDVDYFTLESALCTYKSWHRPNRRYPNVYSDMLVTRIKVGEEAWDEDLAVFWEARKSFLPLALRLEDNPQDPGVVPTKQNQYRETGKVPMMGHVWPELWSPFDDRVARAQSQTLTAQGKT